MKNYNFIIIESDVVKSNAIKEIAETIENLNFISRFDFNRFTLNKVLESKPDIIFMEVIPTRERARKVFGFIADLNHYFTIAPKVIILSKNAKYCLDAIKTGCFDYFVDSFTTENLKQTLLRLEKIDTEIVINETPDEIPLTGAGSRKLEVINNEEKIAKNKLPLTICIRNYADFRYIDANEICLFKADNNTTDIHLLSGEVITAYKTLKVFELALKPPFYRVHNNCIINSDHVMRIQSGTSELYMKNFPHKIAFSKTYRKNIYEILSIRSSGNYIEI